MTTMKMYAATISKQGPLLARFYQWARQFSGILTGRNRLIAASRHFPESTYSEVN